MIFLFSFINISFTFFFFLFGRLPEGILFSIISIVYIVYFSSIVSFFLEKDDEHDDTSHHEIEKKESSLTLGAFLGFLRKGSYYVSFLFFYTSLYGLAYGISLVYTDLDFLYIFHSVTLAISLIVTTVYFIFLKKKHETLFLIFRSNCIIFSVIYGISILVCIIRHIIPTPIFIINGLFPLITLLSVISFDIFTGDKKKYVYGLFLTYLPLVVFYCILLLFPTASELPLLIGEGIFFSSVYIFVFPSVKLFGQFSLLSIFAGLWMNYVLVLVVLMVVVLLPISQFYTISAILLLAYHYGVYWYLKNHFSYIIGLIILTVLYIKIFFHGDASLLQAIFVVFSFPCILISVSYSFYEKYPIEIYILHSMAIGFSILSALYYLIFLSNIGIFSASLFFFIESLLLFASYLRLKK